MGRILIQSTLFLTYFISLKKIDKQVFTGEICTEFQLSMSANFIFSWVVNLFKKRL
jgi:hypothetical protein